MKNRKIDIISLIITTIIFQAILAYIVYQNLAIGPNRLDGDPRGAILEVINFVARVTGTYIAVVGSNACYAKVKKMEIVPLNDRDALLLIVTNINVVLFF